MIKFERRVVLRQIDNILDFHRDLRMKEGPNTAALHTQEVKRIESSILNYTSVDDEMITLSFYEIGVLAL